MTQPPGTREVTRRQDDGGRDAQLPDGAPGILKCPTGISGIDAILSGGLPRGRPTLVCGAAGCGKTVLAMEFLVRGIVEHGEPGVFVAFEEDPADLAQNFASLGHDLAALERDGKLRMIHIKVERSDIEETGEYDLEGLFIRLASAIAAVGARRIVLDTIEALFSGLSNQGIARAELRRLFAWLKEERVTAIVTGERGNGMLTRFGLEEYVADCVIDLDNRVEDGAAVRRLRVVKYRGSGHGANQYPFLIDGQGVSVVPITSLTLAYPVSDERVLSGVPRLDTLLGGGVFRGSSTLVSGTAGSGKTSLAAAFAEAACRRGERALYLAFEESPAQIARNMHSIGLDLEPWIAAGSLRMHSARPTAFGLETHLASIHRAIEEFRPDVVAIDPISHFQAAAGASDATAMLTRLIDLLKARGITSVFTSLTRGGAAFEETAVGISSLMDTWILLLDLESNGERNRAIYVLKSRGTAHSNQVREFRLTDNGIELDDVYAGPGGILVGSARLAQEGLDRAATARRATMLERRDRRRRRDQEALEARIAALRAEHATLDEDVEFEIDDERTEVTGTERGMAEMALHRQADLPSAGGATSDRTATP
jgi:circadian clock protein KaiC